MDYSLINSAISNSGAAANAALSSNSARTTTSSVSADTFLKLLVTQMQNQDPLNPMDNAQVTSQLAQISTVTGIGTLNTTVGSLNTQLVQMQAMQGASLVGRAVLVDGKSLSVSGNEGKGSFDLSGAASSVKVDIVSASGAVIGTVNLGAQAAGRHDFTWPATAGVTDSSGLTFNVTASNGGATVAATPLMRDTVDAVNLDGDTLTVDLEKKGQTPYISVKGFD